MRQEEVDDATRFVQYTSPEALRSKFTTITDAEGRLWLAHRDSTGEEPVFRFPGMLVTVDLLPLKLDREGRRR